MPPYLLVLGAQPGNTLGSKNVLHPENVGRIKARIENLQPDVAEE